MIFSRDPHCDVELGIVRVELGTVAIAVGCHSVGESLT